MSLRKISFVCFRETFYQLISESAGRSAARTARDPQIADICVCVRGFDLKPIDSTTPALPFAALMQHCSLTTGLFLVKIIKKKNRFVFLHGAKRSTVPANAYVALQKSPQQPLCEQLCTCQGPRCTKPLRFCILFHFRQQLGTLGVFGELHAEAFCSGALLNIFDRHKHVRGWARQKGQKKIKIRAGAEQKRQEERSPLHLLLP